MCSHIISSSYCKGTNSACSIRRHWHSIFDMSSSQGSGEIEAAKRSLFMAKKWAASTEATFKVVQEQAASVAARLKDAEKEASIAREQVKEAEEYLRSVQRKLETSQSTNHQRRLLTLMEKLNNYTECTICYQKFSTDIRNEDENIRKHLPVLSSSRKCDHYFCHGCILKRQIAIAEENNGRVPKWIKCYYCNRKTSFCPSEPKYHTLLIEWINIRSQSYADAQVKEEEKEEAQASSKVAVAIHSGERRRTNDEPEGSAFLGEEDANIGATGPLDNQTETTDAFNEELMGQLAVIDEAKAAKKVRMTCNAKREMELFARTTIRSVAGIDEAKAAKKVRMTCKAKREMELFARKTIRQQNVANAPKDGEENLLGPDAHDTEGQEERQAREFWHNRGCSYLFARGSKSSQNLGT